MPAEPVGAARRAPIGDAERALTSIKSNGGALS
jgi:hypothetical protein